MTEREGALPYGSRLDVSLREKAEKPVDFTTYNKIFTLRAYALDPDPAFAGILDMRRVVNTGTLCEIPKVKNTIKGYKIDDQ